MKAEVLMNELLKLPATLFSPAKMVYIAYVILLVWKTTTPSHCEFFLVSLLFLAIEITHNDWGRIRLNNSGEKNRPEWLRPK
jgi:hypothetical protein